MFDNTVEEGMEQIQAETEEMSSQKNGCGVNDPQSVYFSWATDFIKDYEENIRKDGFQVDAHYSKSDIEFIEYLKSDKGNKHQQKMNEIYRQTKLYDFGTGEMSTEGAIYDFYGEDIFRRVREEIEESEMPDSDRRHGFVSPELFKEMKAMRGSKIVPKAKKQKPKKIDNQQKTCLVSDKIIQRKRKKGDDYFKIIERGVIKNEAYRKIFKGPRTIYDWMWANIVRDTWKDTKGYPIKEQYFNKRLLAYCSSYRKIGKDCFLHKNKVKEYIDAFKEAGIIKVEHLTPVGKTRGQSVFILGERKMINGELKDIYYIDEIFLSRKDGQNVPD